MSTIAHDVIIPTYMGNRSDRTFEPTGLATTNSVAEHGRP